MGGPGCLYSITESLWPIKAPVDRGCGSGTLMGIKGNVPPFQGRRSGIATFALSASTTITRRPGAHHEKHRDRPKQETQGGAGQGPQPVAPGYCARPGGGPRGRGRPRDSGCHGLPDTPRHDCEGPEESGRQSGPRVNGPGVCQGCHARRPAGNRIPGPPSPALRLDHLQGPAPASSGTRSQTHTWSTGQYGTGGQPHPKSLGFASPMALSWARRELPRPAPRCHSGPPEKQS